MKIYRVQHKASGLFYRPCRDVEIKVGDGCRLVKSNLSKKPKLYQCRPSVGMLSGSYYNHLLASESARQQMEKHPTMSLWDVGNLRCLREILGSEWDVQRQTGIDTWESEGPLKP